MHEVLHISCDERQIVLQSCCCDETIWSAERVSSPLTVRVKNAPTIRNRGSDRKNTVTEAKEQISIEPDFQFVSSASRI